MHRQRTTLLIAAITAVVALSGCEIHKPVSPESMAPTMSSVASSAPSSQAGELPPPDALTDVLYRLTDPTVPGTEKLNLLEGAKPSDAETLDRFSRALKDAGNLPLTVDATDISWSDQDPGSVLANVAVTPANDDAGGFSLPMEFRPNGTGWQLARKTAEMLLTFGSSQTAGSPAPAPTPTP